MTKFWNIFILNIEQLEIKGDKMQISYAKKFIRIRQVWFENMRNLFSKEDILFFHGISKTGKIYKNFICTKQTTLISNLGKDEGLFFPLFKKNTRYEINRGKRENIKTEIFSSEYLLKNFDTVIKMGRCYEEMFHGKGMNNHFNYETTKAYLESGAFYISRATFNDIPLVYHAYIVYEINSRLLYSCSDFRSIGVDKNLIGRANRLLHYNDMCELKLLNVKNYDWGGIVSSTQPNGIDRFKMDFGGTVYEYYNYIAGNTILGNLIILFLKFKLFLNKI